MTERRGAVVTHRTRIWEVSGSNPGADQPDWGFFHGFPQSSRQMLGWIFITTTHLTIIHQIHINKNVNVRLYIVTNLRKFFTDRFEILTQRCIHTWECLYIPFTQISYLKYRNIEIFREYLDFLFVILFALLPFLMSIVAMDYRCLYTVSVLTHI